MTDATTAAVLLIGDEVLSGRTKDKNLGFIADYLTALGIDLKEARVVADDEGGFEVLCGPHDFAAVKDALEAAGFKAEVAEIIMKPATETEFTGDDAAKMQKLLDALENLDDVQEVYTNAVIEE